MELHKVGRMQRKIRKGAAVILPPFLLVYLALSEEAYTAALSCLILGVSLVPFFQSFEHSKPRPRDMVPIAVMSTIAALGRTLFAAIPGFNPVSAVVMIAGMYFGSQAGFLAGALSALASNLFLGQGPWTPWQMYAWGMIGFTAGLMKEKGVFRFRWMMYGFGFMSGILFGWFMNLYYLIGYVHPVTLGAFLTACVSSAWMDAAHGASTLIFLLLLERPWGKKLIRLQKKYGICKMGE